MTHFPGLFYLHFLIQRRHRKKPPTTRVVTLQDSDEDSLNDTGSSAAAVTETASSVPLKYERRLQKMKDLAKQMPDSQLLLYFLVCIHSVQVVHCVHTCRYTSMYYRYIYVHFYVYRYVYTCMLTCMCMWIMHS